jgi:hypothetical protein
LEKRLLSTFTYGEKFCTPARFWKVEFKIEIQIKK